MTYDIAGLAALLADPYSPKRGHLRIVRMLGAPDGLNVGLTNGSLIVFPRDYAPNPASVADARTHDRAPFATEPSATIERRLSGASIPTCPICDGKFSFCEHSGSVDDMRNMPAVRLGPCAIDARVWDAVMSFATESTLGAAVKASKPGPSILPVSVFGADWWALIMPIVPHPRQKIAATIALTKVSR